MNKNEYINQVDSLKAGEELKEKIAALAEKKPAKRAVKKYLLAAACMAVVLVAAAPILIAMGGAKAADSAAAVDQAIFADSYFGAEENCRQPEEFDEIAVEAGDSKHYETAEKTGISCVPAFGFVYNPVSEAPPKTESTVCLLVDDRRVYSLEEIKDYYGGESTVLPSFVPQGFSLEEGEYSVYTKKEGEVYFDANTFTYSSPDGGLISVCISCAAPIYPYGVQNTEKTEITTADGAVELIALSCNEGEEYCALFSVGERNYCVSANGVDATDFERTVLSILN